MSKNSHIRDNDDYGKVANFLVDKIQQGSSLSIVSAYFTIYAFDKLRDSLESIDNLRFLLGEPSFISGMDQSKTESKAFVLTEGGLKLDNYLTQSEIARACAEWIEAKVEIKSVRHSNLLHGKMYYIANEDQADALMGSSNFTVRGLGLSERSNNIELNFIVDDESDCADLKAWFDKLWESDKVENVKKAVTDYLKDAYCDRTPEFIYYKTLYHIFEDVVKDAMDTEFVQENESFTGTQIWEALYLFQEHGVKACLHKLNAYNGCIIADSVGLGKTYEALAIIKYFELRNPNAEVLVLCPKKLEHNWTLYSKQYKNKYNPFKKDSFRYIVRAHSDLTERSPTNFEWDDFDLVVIDESHNFRNRPAGTFDEHGNLVRKSRYNKLLEDIIQSGCKTQVLMLSATPVNNRLLDLENQIRLITEDTDNAFQQTGIASISATLKTAQDRFDEWTAETGHLSNQSERQERLADSLNADFFTLLDRLTIARSQHHIRKFYSETLSDSEFAGFPDRAQPRALYPEIDLQGKFPTYRRLSDQIDKYKLAHFNPSGYIRPECLHHYGDKQLRQRETNLVGMMKVNFLKRLESSVHAFAITLGRTIRDITKLESDIEAYKKGEADKNAGVDSLGDIEDDAEYAEDDALIDGMQAGDKQFYPFEHLELDIWLTDLQRDKAQLEELHKAASYIKPDRDAKLAQLKQLISQKVEEPTINKKGKQNRKVLVFTASADTAKYLYEQLHKWGAETLKIECAAVTGASNSTTLPIKSDFNEILTHFSPISKKRDAAGETELPEIDLLIATDCISEGQNLQDCDYLINYDIHWNPVRIIQRFGRIDRIGSKNELVYLTNFWPTPELDEYINLKPRVEARMALVDLTATGDDDPLSLKEKKSLEDVWTHRDEQLRRMQTEILDLEEIEQPLNINQFTLDDFRTQLLNYLQTKKGELSKAPLGLYAVTAPKTQGGESVDIKPGVIFCFRQVVEESNDKEGKQMNPIYPYYLVYVSEDGTASIGFTNPKRILERLNELCREKNTLNTKLCRWFNVETDNGRDMTIYEMLLEKGMQEIQDAYNQKVHDQLDASPDALLPIAENQITENTEYELITWLVIGHSEK